MNHAWVGPGFFLGSRWAVRSIWLGHEPLIWQVFLQVLLHMMRLCCQSLICFKPPSKAPQPLRKFLAVVEDCHLAIILMPSGVFTNLPCQEAQWQMAGFLFHSLSAWRLRPDTRTCNAYISACEKAKATPVKEFKTNPNHILIQILCHWPGLLFFWGGVASRLTFFQ